MIQAEHVYRLAGVLVASVALLDLRAKRWASSLFWAAYAANLLFGSVLPDFVSGCLVIVIALVGGLGGMKGGGTPTTTDEEREANAARHGNRLFLPALLVPGLTLVASFGLRGRTFVDAKNVSIVSLAGAAIVALAVALVLFRQPPSAPAREARRLMNLVGWAAVLPQMLAALGALFADAGVGARIAELLDRALPLDHRFVVVATYTLGMALFTIVMGNAFAAFPVMTAAVGIPLLVHKFGGDPAVVAAVGMLSGFCGTLMTPMAANFNIVPAALLELPDERAVIRAQLPTALVVLAANTVLMNVLAFRAP